MTVNFDQIIDRHQTGSVKWDFIERYLDMPEKKLLPMWVSDYDFACPPPVVSALQQRVTHGVFGYSERDEHYYSSVVNWFSQRHQLNLQQEWICSVEGVIPGLSLLVQMLSKPGDGVVVQGPYYGSFAKIITLNERRLLENPLIHDEALGYCMDYLHLEQLFSQEKPALFILCNPHNPSGRCWSKEELSDLLMLCERHNVKVLSDEIWADLLLPGERFTSVLHLDKHWHSRLIVACSASKTFGLSSLRISNFILPDNTLRERFNQRLNAHGLDVFNALSLTAATAAYQYGASWLDQLLEYLAKNRAWFAEQIQQQIPWARLQPAQGTYLAWLDCRSLGVDDSELKRYMTQIAHIAPSMGEGFGPQGKGFVRLNLGCPRRYLELAIEGLKRIGDHHQRTKCVDSAT
ncbi:MalY/PatB family protein [Limnobaculum parvum]|uniref:cysteine-S-conjugate beta-lyase n=1 Tax=Limnobaculum parvum TaxID=2172103 RepID=A0A2Y9U0E6_9GAMM|nr:MalY/PatB family protein [Limnobaculum parvum]AWH89518.1 pyridoxal phosphate-dependent aminotransferase [Limnobaculum parvum]